MGRTVDLYGHNSNKLGTKPVVAYMILWKPLQCLLFRKASAFQTSSDLCVDINTLIKEWLTKLTIMDGYILGPTQLTKATLSNLFSKLTHIYCPSKFVFHFFQYMTPRSWECDQPRSSRGVMQRESPSLTVWVETFFNNFPYYEMYPPKTLDKFRLEQLVGCFCYKLL